jgi:hypothetical protein
MSATLNFFYQALAQPVTGLMDVGDIGDVGDVGIVVCVGKRWCWVLHCAARPLSISASVSAVLGRRCYPLICTLG